MRHWLLLLLYCGFFSVSAQEPYFPPLSGNVWETIAPSALGWRQDKLEALLKYLGEEDTKAFIVLYDGRIAIEQYYGSFTRDSLWYWASAGKSLRAFLVGQAQEEGLLNINDLSSKYLGSGWTSAPRAKEDLITIRHQLTMSSGLDDNLGDDDCTLPSCLQYKADAGTRWAYHNAVYTLLKDVLEKASGMNINQFTNSRIKNKTGMGGLWLQTGNNNIYFSNARTMARYGWLISNKGIWNRDTLMRDTAYFRQMVTPSQKINQSYGYLWWLNGQSSHMLPQTQIVFQGPIIPNAPPDLIAALGKNDQKLYVVPSRKMVVVRLGESVGIPLYSASAFDNVLWGKIMEMLAVPTGTKAAPTPERLRVIPNPASDAISLDFPGASSALSVHILDVMGREIKRYQGTSDIDISNLPRGVYFVRVQQRDRIWQEKLVKP